VIQVDFFSEFMPHGHCYAWTPSILWASVVSDVTIAISYFSIPVALLYFMRKREDLPFSWIFALFGVFILACGTGHVFEVWNTWHGAYGGQAVVKVVTAVASIGTAAVLWWPVIPRALALPSPRQLSEANESLRAEIATREQAERALHEQARELGVARDAAQAANRAKSQFLANMSHEIRTPLNAVIGLSEILIDSDLSEGQRDHLRTVIDSGDVLLTVVNDILDYSRIEAGKIDLESVAFDLDDVVGDTLRSLAVRAEHKGLELLCQLDANVPRALRGDPGRLRQVIANLVSNAITFTEHGEVEVRVERESDGLLRFSVRDTGMGIDPSDIDRLFESFEQADKSSSRRFGGTGLGLSISRGLVELLGGTIHAKSALGTGSTFTFTARFEELPVTADEPRREAVPLAGSRVLIVDDNPTNRVILFTLARRWGMDPVPCSSADEALTVLREIRPDGVRIPLLLLDLHMPVTDGFGLAEKIRSDPSFDELAIVMLTSAGMAPDLRRCEQLRIAARIMKPVKEYELHDVVARVLGHRTTIASSGHVQTVRRAVTPGEQNLAPQRILLVEDSVPNQKVALAMLQSHGHTVVVANDGHEAVGLFSAQEFDAILMDIQMPGMDGFACTAAIRSTEAGSDRHIPIVAMTAHALAGDREKCLAAGMDDYVSKPIRREELFRALGLALAPRRGLVDFSGVLSQLGNDHEALRDIVRAYVDETRENLERIRVAIASGAWTEVRRLAHTVKGAMRMFRSAEALELAQRLEQMPEQDDRSGAAELYLRMKASVESVIDVLTRFADTGVLDDGSRR
jgi:two-component system, sensor histidine kinase and response regulator